MTADQVAKHLGIGVKTWTAYVKRGQPSGNPAPRPRKADMAIIGGRWRVRWRRSAIDNWNNRRPSKQQPEEQ